MMLDGSHPPAKTLGARGDKNYMCMCMYMCMHMHMHMYMHMHMFCTRVRVL